MEPKITAEKGQRGTGEGKNAVTAVKRGENAIERAKRGVGGRKRLFRRVIMRKLGRKSPGLSV